MKVGWISMTENFYYRSYSEYLKEKYGMKVWRLPIDNNNPCPNRINGKTGCSFCDGNSFLPDYLDENDNIETQLTKGFDFFSKRLGISAFIGYFQANTNTYGDMKLLLSQFRTVMGKPWIVGLVISTRPDFIYKEIIEGIANLSSEFGKEVWIEIGLQSVYDETLERINRGHNYNDFCNAVAIIRKYGKNIKIGVHMILGLPSEDHNMMVNGIKKLFIDTNVDGIKIRPLDLMDSTPIYEDYKQNPDDFIRFSDETYVNLICDIIENIPNNVVIMRLANFKSFISISTDENKYTKGTILRKIEHEFDKRQTKQGYYCGT